MRTRRGSACFDMLSHSEDSAVASNDGVEEEVAG